MDSDDEINQDEDFVCETNAGVSESGVESLDDVASDDIAKKNSYNINYKILSNVELFQYMMDFVEEVTIVTEIRPEIVRILLTHLRWDKEKLMDRFYDGDQEKLFSEAGLLYPFNADSSKTNLENSSDECKICLSVQPSSHIDGLECGHRFCTDCWCSYLTIKIMDEGVQTLTCAFTWCRVLVDDARVMKFVTDSKVRRRYRHLILNTFVESNAILRWCPAPDCTYAVKLQRGASNSITCFCKHTFCFSCGEIWHEPIKCDMFREWIRKCSSEAETSNWIVTNTKGCPICKVSIEKHGGCNHVICRNCKANFCWVCLGPWELHGDMYYTCHKYDDEKSKTARNDLEKSRIEIDKLVFYSNRFNNHKNSRKLEFQLYDTVEKKMAEMQEQNFRWIDVQFLKTAVDTLCKCRETLMFAYVFGYYLEKNNQTLIFEENKKDLERSTEFLSEFLERDISSETLSEIVAKVKNLFIYCEKRQVVLLKHMKELIES